jgi:hypothetical protein
VISIWFHYGDICLATAAVAFFGKMGTMLSNSVTPWSYREYNSFTATLWPSLVFNVIAMGFASLINVIDEKNESGRMTTM